MNYNCLSQGICLFCFLLLPLLDLEAQPRSVPVKSDVVLPAPADLPNQAFPLHEAGKICLEEEEYTLALDYFLRSQALAEKAENFQLQNWNHFQLGKANFWLSRYEAAGSYLDKALQFHPELLTAADSIDIFKLFTQINFYTGNLELAHQYAFQRLRLLEKSKDSLSIAAGYQFLAEVEREEKKFESALANAKKALLTFEAKEQWEQASYSYDLIGETYHQLGNYQEALSFKLKSCQVIDTTLRSYDHGYCDHTIALTLGKMGKLDQAIFLQNRALHTFTIAGLKEEATLAKASLGEVMADKGQCIEGIQLMKEAIREATALQMQPLRRIIFEMLYKTCKRCGHVAEAADFQEKYFLLNDSIHSQNTQVNIARLANQYELDKKNHELAMLKKNERLTMLYILLLGGGMLLLLAFAISTYRLLKKQRRFGSLLQEKTEEIERQYKALHKANKKLKVANKELEQFAYLASHDLKAPLRTIGSYTSLLNRRYFYLFDEDGRSFLNFITEAVVHMNLLLEDVLAYSRLDKAAEEKTTVHLTEKVSLAVRLLHETIREKSATIEFGDLPAVNGNATQLYLVLQNLIDNALKFIPAERQPFVKIKANDLGKTWQLSVADNGIGIRQEHAAQVFTLFKRLHTKDKYKGTGIGLAICKKIIENHGGRIWLESDGASGTTFYFTLKKENL